MFYCLPQVEIDALAYDHGLTNFDRIREERDTVYRPWNMDDPAMIKNGQCVEIHTIYRMSGRKKYDSLVVQVRSLSPGHVLRTEQIGSERGLLKVLKEVQDHNLTVSSLANS